MPHKPIKAPAFIAPQIPVLSAEPPTGSGWIHEIKHDGFRTLVGIIGKDALRNNDCERRVIKCGTQHFWGVNHEI
jgi:hypothetical protein